MARKSGIPKIGTRRKDELLLIVRFLRGVEMNNVPVPLLERRPFDWAHQRTPFYPRFLESQKTRVLGRSGSFGAWRHRGTRRTGRSKIGPIFGIPPFLGFGFNEPNGDAERDKTKSARYLEFQKSPRFYDGAQRGEGLVVAQPLDLRLDFVHHRNDRVPRECPQCVAGREEVQAVHRGER